MKYGIEFTAEELETLNCALNAASVYFTARANSAEQDGIREVNTAFADETSALWLRVYAAQKAAGLRKEVAAA